VTKHQWVFALALLACAEPPAADTGRENAPPVVEWAFASIVVGGDTTMDVIVSDPDGGSDVAGAVAYWMLDGDVTATVEQADPREHADGRVYFFTRHPSPSPYDGYEVVATDAAGAASEPYVVELGGRR